MRKFGIKYSRLHLQPARVRAAFVSVKRPQGWHDVLEEFYGTQRPSADMIDATRTPNGSDR